jgi:hypothetical protein
MAICAALLPLGAAASASTGEGPLSQLELLTFFDAAKHETHVLGNLSGRSCIVFRLRNGWRRSEADDVSVSLTQETGARIDVRFRSLGEPTGRRSIERPNSAAAALLLEYEELLGKPVQAVSFRRTGYAGVSRWSATWVDANLASPSHSFTVESLIVSLSGGSTLELTFPGDWNASALEPEVAHLLSTLHVVRGKGCGLHFLAG